MWSLTSTVVALASLHAAAAQSKYGWNHVDTSPDLSVVEAKAFPAPNVTLLSPAFLANASFPAGWTKGTAGATSESGMRT